MLGVPLTVRGWLVNTDERGGLSVTYLGVTWSGKTSLLPKPRPSPPSPGRRRGQSSDVGARTMATRRLRGVTTGGRCYKMLPESSSTTTPVRGLEQPCVTYGTPLDMDCD